MPVPAPGGIPWVLFKGEQTERKGNPAKKMERVCLEPDMGILRPPTHDHFAGCEAASMQADHDFI
jgi:hypothetical protein